MSDLTDEERHEALLNAIIEHPTRVVVIGGGAAGLVAARDIARPGFDVTVLEAEAHAGGSVASHELAGIRLDSGAESFATRGGHVAELLEQLHLTDDVEQPLAAGAWLQLPGRAVPTPKAGILGIPSSPLATDVVNAIGWSGAFRAYLDRLIPVLKIGSERNLGRLVRRRMGQKVLDNLVAPVTTGVYSASPDQIDVDVAAPGLNQAMTRYGSLSGAVTTLRGNAKAGSAVGGLVGGMARMIEVLSADAVARGAGIRTGSRVVAVRPADAVGGAGGGPNASDTEAASEAVAEVATDDAAKVAADVDAVFDGAEDAVADGGVREAAASDSSDDDRPARWRVELQGGETIAADVVLVALPAGPALRVLGGASDDLAALGDLGWPQGSTVDLVTLVLDDERLDAAPRGTGMLVAETVPQSQVAAKAMTHVTAKWRWVADLLPAGRHVLRLSYGRAGSASPLEGLDAAAARRRAVADASTLLSIPLAESSVVASDVVRWTNALPIAAEGQRERIETVRDSVAKVEGLEVTGSWLAGTGLASVIPDARQAAERVRALRWRTLTEKTD